MLWSSNKKLSCLRVDRPKGKQIAGEQSWHKTFDTLFSSSLAAGTAISVGHSPVSGRTYEVCLNCGTEFAYVRVDFGHSLSKLPEQMTR
jgi:hypothetical protein